MAGTVVNLTVHGIGPASRTLDPDEDRTWVTVEQFEQVLDAVVGRRDVQLTFDDGNASDVEIALPRLLERGLSAEFFVLAGLLGEPGRLAAEDVRELRDAGMRVGSHGWAHRDWRRIGPDLRSQEFVDARRVLAELIGRHVLNHLHRTGVRRAFTSDGGRAVPKSWLQARNSLRADMDPDWVHNVLDARQSPSLRARQVVARGFKRIRG
jgi:peptidoglycan/xylan/chitin deacetylase (PgdA/CDA1 family)